MENGLSDYNQKFKNQKKAPKDGVKLELKLNQCNLCGS